MPFLAAQARTAFLSDSGAGRRTAGADLLPAVFRLAATERAQTPRSSSAFFLRGRSQIRWGVLPFHDDQRGSRDVADPTIAALTHQVPHTRFGEEEKVKKN
jgi:hypothetical protein